MPFDQSKYGTFNKRVFKADQKNLCIFYSSVKKLCRTWTHHHHLRGEASSLFVIKGNIWFSEWASADAESILWKWRGLLAKNENAVLEFINLHEVFTVGSICCLEGGRLWGEGVTVHRTGRLPHSYRAWCHVTWHYVIIEFYRPAHPQSLVCC